MLRAAPEDLALQVLDGTVSLDAAHATAQQRKTEKVIAAARYALALKKEAEARKGFGSASYLTQKGHI